MKTVCTYSYDLDCLVSSLIIKWAKNIPSYDFVVEPLAHWRIEKYCETIVNKKPNNYFFIGFDKDELLEGGCKQKRFTSIKKQPHKSLSKLLYQKFSDRYEFTDEQKALIAFTNDKHTFGYSKLMSYHLDILFHILNRNKFVYMFSDGICSFDSFSQSIIKNDIIRFHTNKESELNDFIFEDSCAFVGIVDDIYHYEYKYMKDHKTMVLIDADRKRVYFRNKNPDEDVINFCKNICDGGGTNDYCSGELTDKFLEVLKNGS